LLLFSIVDTDSYQRVETVPFFFEKHNECSPPSPLGYKSSGLAAENDAALGNAGREKYRKR